jgi:protein gp37
MDKDWVTAIRHQCRVAGVPFFFKQWGGIRKGKSGRALDGQTYDEMPPRGVFPVLDDQRRKSVRACLETLT